MSSESVPQLDYYETLGVSRDASDEEIRKAYRKLVLRYHPDRNPNSKEAEAKIREINAAYEVVGDPEIRKSYERLRFGAYEVKEAAPDPSMLLQQMEERLYEEGRRELFALLIKDVKRIKAELAIIRERTVARQGYDTFKERVVLERASEVMHEFVAPELEIKKMRLVAVALQMMISQRVVRPNDERHAKEVKERLQEAFQRGRLSGFRDALGLFYVRR